MAEPTTSILWFRRDLRLDDHPSLAAAAQDGPVTALFVLDDVLLRSSGAPRTAYLLRALRALDADLREHGGRLTVRSGRPEQVVPNLALELGAGAVHISADFAPYGLARDARVRRALGDVPLVATGSPYAVAPDRVQKRDGAGYQVFTPFYRAWREHGWRSPATSNAATTTWHTAPGDPIPADPALQAQLPPAGERAARADWERFRETGLAEYDESRNRPDLDGTSRMSPHLKLGAIHPRTMLASLGGSDGPYLRQLAWREFYASVLYHWPRSGHGYFRPRMASMSYDTGPGADGDFAAWAAGRTGYPIVDAGMRQLLATGWMHNRVRMITASFLVKDLHLEWTRGARHFMDHLIDGDLASNQHGWQWTAGTGTDASPYFRVFNPVGQGRRFDPNGDYVRRWIPELRSLAGPDVHEPWSAATPVRDYPPRILDHAEERLEALARYQALTGRP